MSEDKFFGQVKSTMEHYAPEVPTAVYAGMRRKLWLSQFLHWNAARLNAWYVLMLATVGATAIMLTSGGNAPAQRAGEAQAAPAVATALPVVATEAGTEVVTPQATASAAGITQARSQRSAAAVVGQQKTTTESVSAEVPAANPTVAKSETTEPATEIVVEKASQQVAAPVEEAKSNTETKPKKKIRPTIYTNGK